MKTELAVLQIGDIVRIARLDRYLTAFANRVRDRDAEVLWLGPDVHGQFIGKARVKFLRRGGRGKEFIEQLDVRDLVKIIYEK